MNYEVVEAEILDDSSNIKSKESEPSSANSNYNDLKNALKISNSLIIRKVYSSVYDFLYSDEYTTIPRFVAGICTYYLYIKCGNGQTFTFDIASKDEKQPFRIKPEAKSKMNGLFSRTLVLNDAYPLDPERCYDNEVSSKYSDKLLEISDVVKKYGFIIERKLFYKLCNTPDFMEIYIEKEDSSSILLDKLEEIIELYDSGKLSDKEFKLLKSKLLESL